MLSYLLKKWILPIVLRKTLQQGPRSRTILPMRKSTQIRALGLTSRIKLTLNPCKVHPKLRNINPHIFTYSLISWNPREWMFVVQISLLIVIFLSFISQNLSLMQTIKEVNPHPRIASCVNMWTVTLVFLFLFLFSFLCHLLNVGACVRHVAWEGQVEWTSLA